MSNDQSEREAHFNKLTPAEAERLALLLEEMGEAQQAIGKILRHGYESYNPRSQSGVTNREMLERELGDVRHAMFRMCEAGDFSDDRICGFARCKAEKVRAYLHHQGKERS